MAWPQWLEIAVGIVVAVIFLVLIAVIIGAIVGWMSYDHVTAWSAQAMRSLQNQQGANLAALSKVPSPF